MRFDGKSIKIIFFSAIISIISQLQKRKVSVGNIKFLRKFGIRLKDVEETSRAAHFAIGCDGKSNDLILPRKKDLPKFNLVWLGARLAILIVYGTSTFLVP
jgi:hypothetical protein